MAAPENVNSFVGRLATFEAPKQLTKRRASSTTKKKTPTTVSWPHAAPTPEDLSRAGFYYTPTANNPDNVTCFTCHRKLDGWEPEDDPALEHLTHAPDCVWAINVCVSHRPVEENEDPMGIKMVAARTATFEGNWPHEDKKGWKCKTKKMVEAGWTFDPSPEYDDGVSCFYCMLSLDGWEPKDSPMEEHRKRSPECPFFMLVEEHAASRKAAKGKRGRASTASRASRLSVQSNNFDTFSEAPSFMSLGDDVVRNDDSILTSATDATTTTMPRGRKASAKAKAAPKKTTRGKKAAKEPESTLDLDQPTLEPVDADGDLSLGDLAANDEDSVLTTATTATTASKAGKGRKGTTKAKTTAKATTRKTSRAKKTADSTLVDEPTVDVADTELEVAPPKPAGRATRRTSRLEPPSYLDDSQAAPEPSKPKATRAKGGRKPKVVEESRLSNDESQLQSELQDAVARAEEPEPAKPRRGTKRTSDGVPKDPKVDDSSVMIVEEQPKPAPKAKRGRKPKQVEEPAPEPVEEVQMDAEPAPAPAPIRKASATAKGKRGRKPKAQVIEDSTVAEPEPVPVPEPELTLEDFPAPPSSAAKRASSKVPVRNMRSPLPPAEATPEPKPAPAPEVELPAQEEQAPSPSPSPVPAKEPTPPPKDLTPSPNSSPQSSDAENKPPSSRPASARPPLSARQSGARVPLADSTPVLTPSKRSAAAAGLSSAHPWSAVDLETVFLQSPATKRLLRGEAYAGDGDMDQDKENSEDNVEDLSSQEQVWRVVRAMTDVEKKMSVEEWVHALAAKGEQRLREECERLVGVFETQGTRAMRALEGVDCA